MPPLAAAGFEGGLATPCSPPWPHPAGGSPGSGFPSQAGLGQGSMHLKFLLALKLRRVARDGGGKQQLREEHPSAPRAGSTRARAGVGVCVCMGGGEFVCIRVCALMGGRARGTTRARVCTRPCMHVDECAACTRTCTPVGLCVCTHRGLRVGMQAHECVCVRTYVFADVYICTCLCTCIGVRMYAYTDMCANTEVRACM